MAQDTSNDKTQKPKKPQRQTPSWTIWQQRRNCSLGDAVALSLDIHPAALTSIKKNNKAKYSSYLTRLKTAQLEARDGTQIIMIKDCPNYDQDPKLWIISLSSFVTFAINQKLWRDKLPVKFVQLKDIDKRNLSEYSLTKNLTLETWDYKDALLLLAGIEPVGALIGWGRYNKDNTWIDIPKIENTAFSDPTAPKNSTTTDHSLARDKDNFNDEKKVDENIEILKDKNAKLGFLWKHWKSAAKSHDDRNSPDYYINWAKSKNYEIPWLDSAIEKGLYKNKQLPIEKPLTYRERETLSIMIAALAKIGTVDITKLSKASTLIAEEAQRMGLTIGETTIETHLRPIKKILANRVK